MESSRSCQRVRFWDKRDGYAVNLSRILLDRLAFVFPTTAGYPFSTMGDMPENEKIEIFWNGKSTVIELK